MALDCTPARDKVGISKHLAVSILSSWQPALETGNVEAAHCSIHIRGGRADLLASSTLAGSVGKGGGPDMRVIRGQSPR